MSGLLSLKWNNHSSVFLNLLENLRLNELYCDATVVCEGKFFPVHKFVLSTCSEYFEEIFSRIECKHPFIIMKDIEISQLEALLNYMYKGEVNVLQDYLSGLIKAAEALKIKGLAVPDQVDSEKEFSINVKKRSNSSSEMQNRKFSKVENYKLSNSTEKNSNKNSHQANNASNNCQEESLECGETELTLTSREKANNLEEFKANVKCEPIDMEFHDALPKEDDSLNFASLLPGGENCEQAKDSDTEESFNSNLPSSHPLYSVSDGINDSPVNNHEDMWQDVASTSAEETLQTNSRRNRKSMRSLNDIFSHPIAKNPRLKRLENSNSSSKQSTFIASFRHQCSFCSYGSYSSSAVKKHEMRIHTGIKPFHCERCSYSCTTKESLRIHFRTHTGERPFLCKYCVYQSSCYANLQKHLKSVHKL